MCELLDSASSRTGKLSCVPRYRPTLEPEETSRVVSAGWLLVFSGCDVGHSLPTTRLITPQTTAARRRRVDPLRVARPSAVARRVNRPPPPPPPPLNYCRQSALRFKRSFVTVTSALAFSAGRSACMHLCARESSV